MSPKPEDVLSSIIQAVESHETTTLQWYVDGFSIDCDADEFWGVVKKVLEDLYDS